MIMIPLDGVGDIDHVNCEALNALWISSFERVHWHVLQSVVNPGPSH